MSSRSRPTPTAPRDHRLKIDPVLRRALELDDDALREQVRLDDARLERARRRIVKEVNLLVPDALTARVARLRGAGAGQTDAAAGLRAGLQRLRERDLLPHPLAGVIVREVLPRVRLRAIVQFTGNRGDLESLGLQVRAQAQDVFTVVGSTAQLKNLATQPACQRLRAPRLFLPAVEQAAAQAEVADVHTPRPLNPTGYEGQNVLVGVIDSALDFTHHAFRDPAGTHGTRLLYYWVQSPYTLNAAGNVVWPNLATLPGQNPDAWTAAVAAGTRPNFNGLNYGRLYTQADVDNALGQANPFGTGANQVCCQPWYQVTATGIDSEHGTHCLGIAAGNGHENNWATAPTHVGAAPQATLVYVCTQLLPSTTGRDATWEDAILDGVDFILRAAAFHNLPVVISISQGNNLGPHNGQSGFDQGIDNFLNSFFDRSIVVAAGNDDDNQGYRSGTVAAGATETFTITNARNAVMYLDVWYRGPELEYRLTRGANTTGWLTAGQTFNGAVGAVNVQIDRDVEALPGLRNIRFFIDDPNAGHAYTVDLQNPHATDAAAYDAWTGSQGWWSALTGSTQHAHTLSDAACGKAILTVGATLKVVPPTPATGETITAYSGAGPTIDGRIKPEIVAVGDGVVSAASNQASGWVTMSGTSMATPLVAGAVALLFEAYGQIGAQLNQDSIKALLIQHANRTNLHLDPAQADYVEEERNRYGNGRLRLIDAIDLSLPNPVDVDVWVRTALDDYGAEPYIGGCFCGAPDIRVFAPGTNDETTQIQWGQTYDVRVTVRNLGDSDAVGTTVRLKYTLPHAAPNDWVEAEDASDQKLVQTVTVGAMNQVDVLFQWRPQAAEIGAAAGQTHFCLLAEVDHAADPLVFAAPTAAGGNAWSTNIKGTNNVALRNLHIA